MLLLAGSAAGQSPAPPPLPDLDVVSIALTPRYPAPTVREIEGVQRAVNPATGQPLASGELQRLQQWPRPGEMVTATARVLNRGAGPSGAFHFRWLLNRKVAAEGRLEGLAPGALATAETTQLAVGGTGIRECTLQPGTWTDLTLPFKWKRGQSLRLEVKLEDPKAQELQPEPDPRPETTSPRGNNSLEMRTDALPFLVTVSRRAYNTWAALRAPGRTAGFEDWIQGQFEVANSRLQGSAYPEAPQGVEQLLRIDRILILPDGEADAPLQANAAAGGWDGLWEYEDARRPSEDAALPGGDLDPALGRSLLRQLGIVDLAGLTVLPEQVRIGGPAVLAGFVQPEISLSETLPEHTVLALNRLAGRRRGFRGTYLLDLPQSARLRVLDNNGRTLPDAEVSVYQKSGESVSPEPIAAGTTNPAGTFPLPNRPAGGPAADDGSALRPNPFGALTPDAGNGLLLVVIRARGHSELAWLPVTAFNLARWHGQSREAVFDLRTRIPAAGAPPPPFRVAAAPEVVDGQRGFRISWSAPEAKEVGGYILYRAQYPTYAWERVGAVTFLRSSLFDPFTDSRAVRYAVAAVDHEGDESGLAEVTVRGR